MNWILVKVFHDELWLLCNWRRSFDDSPESAANFSSSFVSHTYFKGVHTWRSFIPIVFCACLTFYCFYFRNFVSMDSSRRQIFQVVSSFCYGLFVRHAFILQLSYNKYSYASILPSNYQSKMLESIKLSTLEGQWVSAQTNVYVAYGPKLTFYHLACYKNMLRSCGDSS